jgi:hypothetical protein
MSTTNQNTNTTPDDSTVPASAKASISTEGKTEMPRKAKASPCVIGESNLGTELDEGESQVLAEIMRVLTLHKDEVLVTEGAADNSLFVLASGRLAVAHGGGGKRETVVYVMSPGECAGTRAFVDRTGRKATLRAQGHTITHNSRCRCAEPQVRARNRARVVDRSRAFSGQGRHRFSGLGSHRG